MMRYQRTPVRVGWDVLARMLATSPGTHDYIQSRRRRGIPAEGVRRPDYNPAKWEWIQ